MGPPKFAPTSLISVNGLFLGWPGSNACHLQATSKGSQEFRCWLLWYQKRVPCSSLLPDFVITSTAAAPAIPFSGSKLLVVTLTSWMLSIGGTYSVPPPGFHRNML